MYECFNVLYVLEKIAPGANAFVRKAREKNLINKYNLIEDGLNKKL